MFRPFPIVGGSYTDDALPWAHQDTVNYLPVRAEREGTRSPAKLAMVPGMRMFSDVGAGPHRGARDVEGKRFVVSGTKLYQIALDGSATEIGTIPGTGRVCMTHNQIAGGNQVVIGAGSSGYVYNTYTGTFGQITDDAFPGMKSCDFLNQYILGVEPFGRYWFHSALVDAESYNALDEYQAETSPDRIMGLIALHNEVLVFGSGSIEPWTNVPTGNAAFQLQRGSVIESGCASGNTIVKLDNSVFYLTENGQVARLNGYTPQIVSTYALEGAIRDCDWSRAFAFAWEDKGHTVYYITFPDGHTWGYDVRQNEWHRRKSYGLDRWRLNTLFKSGGNWYGGDYQNGNVYQLDWDYALDGYGPIERIRTAPYIHDDGNRVVVNAFEVRMDAGAEESDPYYLPLTITGDLPDALVGDSGTYQYTVTGGDKPLTVAISSGSLPPGATMDDAGLVTFEYTTAGEYSWTVTVTGADGNTASVEDGALVESVTIQRGIKPKVVSWWDFEDSLTDLARGGNDFTGTVTYEANDTATGNRLAEGVEPLSTSTAVGYNLHITTNSYADCAFGARLRVSQLTDCEHLLTVGLDDGSGVAGAVVIGIVGGKWKARLVDAAGTGTIFAAVSTADAVADTETHVGLNLTYNSGTSNSTMELRVNGAAVATHTSAGALNANRSTFVIGTREGTGYRPAVSELFWAHDHLTNEEWLYLYNSGNKRFYADFGTIDYGTTYDAALTAMLGSTLAGVYTLDGTANDSGANPAGNGTLVGGAAFTSLVAAPSGFGSSQVLSLDGTNGRMETDAASITLGTGSLLMNGWFRQSANGAASEVYLAAGALTSVQPTQFMRRVRQGTDATQFAAEYLDGSGGVFTSDVFTGDSRIDTWKMLTYASNGQYGYPIIDGIVVAEPFNYGTVFQKGDYRFIVGSTYNGANAVAGHACRACIIPQGTLRLSQLAKLYDLGAT